MGISGSKNGATLVRYKTIFSGDIHLHSPNKIGLMYGIGTSNQLVPEIPIDTVATWSFWTDAKTGNTPAMLDHQRGAGAEPCCRHEIWCDIHGSWNPRNFGQNDLPGLFFCLNHSASLFPRLVEVDFRFSAFLMFICLVVSTPLKSMKVSWDDYSQYMEQ